MTQIAVTTAMDRPIVQGWWRNKVWVQAGTALGVLVLLLATLLAFIGHAQRSVRIAVASVTLSKVERGVYHDFVPLRGTVVPLDTIYLDALEGGRVERVLAQAGDIVTQGQTLVELTNTELELDVLDREGRLIESITQLQSYQTQLEQNRVANEKARMQDDYDITRLQRSITRHKMLVEKGLEALEVKDSIQDELDRTVKLQVMQRETNHTQESLRLQQLPQVQAQLDKLQQDLNITHSKLENLTVRAPATGLLTVMDLKVGEHRNRGERFAEITPDTGNKLSAAVDEYYLGRVHNGQIATLELGGKNWQLTVSRVYPRVKDGTFTVDLAFNDAAPEGLLPGQAVQGKLALGNDAPGVILPAGAFLEHTGGDWVFVLARDEKSAQRRSIKIGRRNAEQLEILKGLRPGDQVITSDYTGLERIDRVDLTK